MNKFRGECEIKVEGEDIPLLFSLYTFMLFCEKKGVELDRMDKALSEQTSMSTLIWCAIESACIDKSKQNKFTIVDIPEILSLISEGDNKKIADTIEHVITSFNTNSSSDKKK